MSTSARLSTSTTEFHSFHGLMNSINWPSSSGHVWVFIAQLVKHCSANAEATGSNPVEAPKNFSFRLLRNYLNCESTAMATHSFQYNFSNRERILKIITLRTNIVHKAFTSTDQQQGEATVRSGNVTGLKFESRTRTQSRPPLQSKAL